MSRFLKTPNLPESAVTDVIVSGSDKDLINRLSDLGINSNLIAENAELQPYIASHADVNVYNFGNNRFIADVSCKNLKDVFKIEKFISVCSPYPNDCVLNAADIGDFIICNSKITSNNILLDACRTDKTVVDVNQGYAKCSVCIVKRNTFITDDESIYRKCSKINSISALLVSKGSVALEGQNYGFIGGCSGLINKDLLLFNGDISTHSDYNAVSDFLRYHNVNYIDIKNKQLNDVGSILPIKEKGIV